MRSETINIYKFEELSKEVQQEIIDKYTSIDNFCWDNELHGGMLKEYFEEECLNFGFKEGVEINYSLSCSQGDGVSFYGEIDFVKFVKRNLKLFTPYELILLKELNEFCGITIESERNRSGQSYSHKNTMDISVGLDIEKDISHDMIDLIENFEYVIIRELKNLSRRLEKEGYDDIEYRCSNGGIFETIVNMDLEFLENGQEY